MAQELLSSNIDGLFEKHGLEEIQQTLRKMRLEVDKKREDLRVTVGNRYRDLIDAADTISEMKKTSDEVMSHLVTIEDKLGSLKHRQLLGFQTDISSSENQKEIAKVKKEYLVLAAQVRLLMELPELMWKELEMGNISRTAQIQQLGFHLHVGLSVESGVYGGDSVQKWFPVVNRQKVTLTSFNEIIVKESTNQLKAVQLSLEKASDSASALILLRGDSFSQMLTQFLQLRSETVRSISQNQIGVKQQMQSFIQFLVSTFAALHALFIEGFPESKVPQGLLTLKLKSMCQSSAESTVNLLPLNKGLLRQLPPIITDFRPSVKEEWTPLPISAIRSECQNWFQSIRQMIPTEFKHLLDCITHIKTLASLRDAAFSTLQAEPFADQWGELTQRLLGSRICLWREIFQPVLVEKVELVVQSSLDSALDAVQQSSLQNYSKFDFKSWLWTEAVSDLPQSIVAPPKSSGVFMKTRCYTPAVQQLCAQLDQKLGTLREDLAHYQDATDTGADFGLPFDRFEKRAELCSALERRCVESIQRLVSFLKENFNTKADNRILFAFRVVTAVSNLCPNLRLCIETQENGKSWTALVDFLRSSALDLFHLWKEDLLSSMIKDLDVQLKIHTISDALGATSLWDEITIQEEGESGNAVQSQIRVPMNPSFPLQQFLFKVCQEINQIGPHSIPKKAQLSLMEETASAVLKSYEAFITSYPSTLPQAIALQLLFDVRFITAFLLARDNKAMQEKARSLCESLEGRVDPFDLNVFNPHVQTHVKRAVQRLQFVFGPLLTADRHAILWAARLASPASSNKQPETPSVVSLVSSSPRFLPLPLVNQRSSSEANTNKPADSLTKEDSGSSHSRKSNIKKSADASSASATATARASAAAFFGAMSSVSSSWSTSIFGGEK